MSTTTRILMVDDEPDFLLVYSQMLRMQGYEVWQASTGQEGLRATRERRPDLVLLDVQLPDLSGVEVCRQIKADPALRDVFVVLLSGMACGVADKVGGLSAGADDYFTKPMAREECVARIQTLVRLRSVTVALRASEQRHRQLIEMLPEAVGLIDLRGRVQAVNPRGVAMLGYADEAELLAKDIYDLTLPEDHERIRRELATATEGGVARDLKYTFLRKGGESFPAEVSTSVSVEAHGRPVGFVMVAHDISERKRAEEELRALPRRIIEAQEAERQRVARELHDGVNQLIASAKMRLLKVAERAGLSPTAREWLARCDELLVQALEENRHIAQNLRPPDLDELGLAEACRNFCEQFQARTQLNVKWQIPRAAERCPPAVELNLFRILQEALNNVERHAHAQTVRVRLARESDAILLNIQDDGRGFDLNGAKADKRKRPGIGLTNIRERAALLGGTCEIESSPDQGTTVGVRVPGRTQAGPFSTQQTA